MYGARGRLGPFFSFLARVFFSLVFGFTAFGMAVINQASGSLKEENLLETPMRTGVFWPSLSAWRLSTVTRPPCTYTKEARAYFLCCDFAREAHAGVFWLWESFPEAKLVRRRRCRRTLRLANRSVFHLLNQSQRSWVAQSQWLRRFASLVSNTGNKAGYRREDIPGTNKFWPLRIGARKVLPVVAHAVIHEGIRAG